MSSRPPEESVRRRAKQLAARGDYGEAADLLGQEAAQQAAAVQQALVDYTAEAAHQWEALQRAKAETLAQTQANAVSRERAQHEQLLRSQYQRLERDRAALNRLSTATWSKILRAPVPASRELRDQQAEERRLRCQGSFASAARQRRVVDRTAQAHYHASLLEQSDALSLRVSQHAATLVEQVMSGLEHERAAVAALQRALAGEQRQTQTQLRHVEEGMMAAQRTVQTRVRRMRRPGDWSQAMAAATQRGSTLEARVYGDAYRVPSLCALYGPLLGNLPGELPAL